MKIFMNSSRILRLISMTIKRSHIFILLAACLIAAGSSFYMLSVSGQKKHVLRNQLSYKCFKTEQGWGYDILVDHRILIHQPFVPGIAGRTPFSNNQQADSAAQIVIEKIKSGKLPIISHQ